MNTDTSPTQSLPDLKTVKNLANLSLELRLEIRETLLILDAKYWLKRFNQISQKSHLEALTWWRRTSSDIQQKRGKLATDDLKRRMNEIRSQNRR